MKIAFLLLSLGVALAIEDAGRVEGEFEMDVKRAIEEGENLDGELGEMEQRGTKSMT